MNAVKKVLIIRFSSIGDIVLTTPVIRCLKLQTNASVHYLCKKSYQSILISNPYIDKLFVIQKEVKEVVADLKKEQYDYIIDLHHNLRSLQVKWALGVKAFSFDKINWQKWLMVNFKINRLPKVHIVDRYLDSLRSFGIQNDGKGLDYFIPKEEEVLLLDFFKKYNLIFNKTPKYIAFAIGAAHQTKRLPTNKIVEICKKIDGYIVLLGGPQEEEEGEYITKMVGKRIINACGKTSLHQSASLVKQAWKVISPDTGMMHIAAAFHKEIISVWGNTIPEFGMYPYYPKGINRNTTVEIKGLSCRPCSKIGYKKCPKGHFKCMETMKVEHLTQIAKKD